MRDHELNYFDIVVTAVQDGRCEHGNVGGEIQCHDAACGILSQLEILPIRVHTELLHCTLPISESDDVSVG